MGDQPSIQFLAELTIRVHYFILDIFNQPCKDMGNIIMLIHAYHFICT